MLFGSRRAAIIAQSLSESFSQKVGLTARNSYVPLSYSRCSSLECRTHCSTAESFANMCATPVPRAYVKMQRTAQCIGDCHNSRQGGRVIEYLQRCGFDSPTWLLLFAVIMDIRPGHVGHGGVFLIHMPCGHWISPGALGRLFRPCVPASLAGDHGDGPDFCGNT